MLQLVDKLTTRLLRTHLVDKLRDFYKTFYDDCLKCCKKLKLFKITLHTAKFGKNDPVSATTQVLCTHAKISHLVASLPTSCQQVVFTLLVPSCEQVWNKLLTTCNNLVDIIRLVAS